MTTKFSAFTSQGTLSDANEVVGLSGGANSRWLASVLKTYTSLSPTLVTPALGTPASGTLTNCTGLPAAGVVGTAAILGANTFTATQTITQASANAGILASTGYSLTGANTVSAVDIAGTWNSTGQTDFFALRLTDTARHASSKFVNLYAGAAGATSVFNIDRSGNVVGASFTNGASYTHLGSTDGQCYITDGSGSTVFGCKSGGLQLNFYGVINGGTRFTAASSSTLNDLRLQGLSGQQIAVKALTELLTVAASATSTTTIQKPANSIVVGVSVRVTTAIPTAATFTVGDSGSAARFSTAAVSVAANSTDPGTKAGAYYNATAEGIIITPDLTPGANTGRVRVTIHYIEVTPATS